MSAPVKTLQKYILIKDRVELYEDFSLNLLNYIYKYYLDKASLYSDVNIEHHFNFCYNKVCEEFKQEGIDFSNNKELKKYFYNYYHDYFYNGDRFDTKEEINLKDYTSIWKNIFNIDGIKQKNAISLLVDIYLIFEESIK